MGETLMRKTLLNALSMYDNAELIAEYLDLCNESYKGEEYSEKHHILPKILYPEYAKCEWNIVRLKYEDHIHAHKLLAEITDNGFMKSAYLLLSGSKRREFNPSLIPEVREKISKSKQGKSRPDMFGKVYMGASEETVKGIKRKLSKSLKDTLVVKDSTGKKFRVSVTDERFLNGELVSHNKGITPKTSAFKNPEIIKSVISKRTKLYESFASRPIEDLVNYIVESHNSGKTIFSKNRKLSGNYSRIVKLTRYDTNEVLELVVQRLSKDS